MRHLLRLLFPRTCHRIFCEGWELGRVYQCGRYDRKHPRARDGRWARKMQ